MGSTIAGAERGVAFITHECVVDGATVLQIKKLSGGKCFADFLLEGSTCGNDVKPNREVQVKTDPFVLIGEDTGKLEYEN